MNRGKIAFPGFATPAAGFEAPLEMLAACHGRVEDQCATLERLPAHLAAHGADRAAREAAQGALRYFDTSARHHHADEEQDLFPALLACAAPAGRPALEALIAGLRAQHRELERRWAGVRTQLEALARADGVPARAHPTSLNAEDVTQLCGLYRAHIAREEDELLPLAARSLALAQLDALGRAMRLRRGIKEI